MKVDTIHRIANILRELRVLSFVDYLHYLRSILKARAENERFISDHPGYIAPPSEVMFDAYGHTNLSWYHATGTRDAGIIGNLISDHLRSSQGVGGGNARILEWGCGPGRIIRYLRDNVSSDVELYGSDYNGKSIEWCSRHLGGIAFGTNRLSPPFGYDAGFFDCIYAISVFTHLSEEMHYRWMEELERVLKKDGVLLVTAHGVASSDRLYGNDRKKFQRGELVVRGKVEEGKKWYLAYHPESFITDVLLKNWTVLKRVPFGTQDLWVATRN